MPEDYSVSDGEVLVKTARAAIKNYLEKREIISHETIGRDAGRRLDEPRGVFVTLRTYPEKELRGCIGFPEPKLPLINATIEAAISSATRDPRFPALKMGELEKILIEITILTKPERIDVNKPEEYPERIELGKHGLIIEKSFCRGLLLPQVPVEHGWSKEEYLCHLCIKAGLEPSDWQSKDAKLYCFEGIIFEELEPNGKVVKKETKICEKPE